MVALNPDHAPAREALGYVMYKGKWTHKARLPADALTKPPAGGGATAAPHGRAAATGQGWRATVGPRGWGSDVLCKKTPRPPGSADLGGLG